MYCCQERVDPSTTLRVTRMKDSGQALARQPTKHQLTNRNTLGALRAAVVRRGETSRHQMQWATNVSV